MRKSFEKMVIVFIAIVAVVAMIGIGLHEFRPTEFHGIELEKYLELKTGVSVTLVEDYKGRAVAVFDGCSICQLETDLDDGRYSRYLADAIIKAQKAGILPEADVLLRQARLCWRDGGHSTSPECFAEKVGGEVKYSAYDGKPWCVEYEGYYFSTNTYGMITEEEVVREIYGL